MDGCLNGYELNAAEVDGGDLMVHETLVTVLVPFATLTRVGGVPDVRRGVARGTTGQPEPFRGALATAGGQPVPRKGRVTPS